MPNFKTEKPPAIIIYGEDTYLGRQLRLAWTGRKSAHPQIVFIRDPRLDPLLEVASFKAALDQATARRLPLTVITNLASDPTDTLLEESVQTHDNWKIIRVPIIYGPGAPVKDLGVLGNYFKHLLNNEPLLIAGEGLKKIPLLFIDDATQAIDRIVNDPLLPPRLTYPLVPGEVLTEVELAYLIKSLSNTNQKIIFNNHQGEEKTSILNTTGLQNLKLIAFNPATPLREGLKNTLKTLKQPVLLSVKPLMKAETVVVSNRGQLPPKSKNGRLATYSTILGILAVTAAIVVTFLGPLIATAYFGYLGKTNLEKTLTQVQDLKFSEANTAALAAKDNFKNALDNLQKLPGLKVGGQVEHYLQGGEYLASSVVTLIDVGQKLLLTAPSASQWQQATPEIKGAYEQLVLANLELSQTNGVDTAKLKDLEKGLAILNSVFPALPQILGFDQPKKYLILFQNPMELRPTGGFIGSYAKVTVDKGKIGPVTFDDIYNPDGQLQEKNLAAPVPPDMQEAFPSFNKLYIRDANWWISFPDSAGRIATLYKLATGETVDGVIAIDLGLVKKVMAVLGPVYLGSYDDTITASNLYAKTQYQTESDYFAGSPQKKNFLKLLGTKLLDQILQADTNQKLKLAQAFNDSLTEKHLLVSIFADPAASIVAENNWNGQVTAPPSDVLMAVDTNTGGNKANYFVRRTLTYEVKNTYRDGTLEGFLTVGYQNTSQAGSWPDSTYHNWLRILVPKDSFLNDASADQADGSVTATSAVKVGTDGNFTVFSFGFTLPPATALTLKLHYTLPQKLALKPYSKSYELKIIKQPGPDGDPFTFRLATPFGRALSLPAGFKTASDGISLGTMLNTDLNLQVPIN